MLTTMVVAWLTSRSVVRQDALASLRTSHTASRQARRPWVAAALAAAGLILTVQAGSKVRAGRAPEAWRESVQSVYWSLGAGALLFLAGLMAAGWLIQQLARVRWPGLTLRMAMWDSARNLGRTASSAAAMSAAVALVLLPLIGLGAIDAAERTNHRPWGRAGLITVTMWDWQGDRSPAKDPATPTRLAQITDQVVGGKAEFAKGTALGASATDAWWAAADSDTLVLADERLVRLLADSGEADAAVAAFEAGRAIVFQPDLLDAGGRLRLTHHVNDVNMQTQTHVDVPGHVAGNAVRMPVLVPQSLVDEVGLGGDGDLAQLYLSYDRPLTQDERTLANERAYQAGFDWYLSTDTGPDQSVRRMLPWVAAGGIALALAVAIAAAGLALRDGAETRVLLANIGAGRRLLRRSVMVQAMVAAGFGATLGATAVLVPAVTTVIAGGSAAQYLPWPLIAAVVAVPVQLVALAAYLLPPPAASRAVSST